MKSSVVNLEAAKWLLRCRWGDKDSKHWGNKYPLVFTACPSFERKNNSLSKSCKPWDLSFPKFDLNITLLGWTIVESNTVYATFSRLFKRENYPILNSEAICHTYLFLTQRLWLASSYVCERKKLIIGAFLCFCTLDGD